MQKLYTLTDLSTLLAPVPGAVTEAADGSPRALYAGLRDDEPEAAADDSNAKSPVRH